MALPCLLLLQGILYPLPQEVFDENALQSLEQLAANEGCDVVHLKGMFIH